MEEVVRQREQCRTDDRSKEHGEDIASLALDSEETEHSQLRQHQEPQRRDDHDGLDIQLQRKISGDDEANAQKVCDDIRSEKKRSVGNEPYDEERWSSHVVMLPDARAQCAISSMYTPTASHPRGQMLSA